MLVMYWGTRVGLLGRRVDCVIDVSGIIKLNQKVDDDMDWIVCEY